MSPAALRARRVRLGLTQAQLGDVLGYCKHSVFNWERGKVPPARAVELAICWLETERGWRVAARASGDGGRQGSLC